MDTLLEPLVIDNGSGFIKAGVAGQESPRTVFPNTVGRLKYKKVVLNNSKMDGETFVGTRVTDETRGILTLSHPIEHGIVKDWDDMERVWRHAFKETLGQNSGEGRAVLITEAPLNPRKNREKAAEMMFEKFNVSGIFFAMQAVLSLYAAGHTTGVVLDSGDGVTHAVPIYEGFAITHGITRVDIAGRDVTDQMQLLLRGSGHVFSTTAETEIVRAMKEKMCYVLLNPNKELAKEGLADRTAEYTLPDGSVIQVGPERHRAPEVLFNPSLIGSEYMGVHEALSVAIAKSDIDIRKTLYGKIFLAGGNTLLSGFTDRLLNEVKRQAPKETKVRIHAPKSEDRQTTTWLGGSILASLNSFSSMVVSKKEYDEDRSIIHRKTF